MRRHPVVGLAVPGRKLQHRQIRREEFQRARQLLHARPVAADHGEADRRRLRPRRDRARQIRDDQTFGALGDIGKGQRAAGREQFGGRSCRRLHASLIRAKRLDAVEQAVGIFRRRRHLAGQRGIEIGIGHLDQMLELSQFVVREIGDLGVGKPAENEIHLAGAAMPAAKQQPLAAVVEAVARSCRSRHLSQSNPNAKSPDVPGGVDIAWDRRMSALFHMSSRPTSWLAKPGRAFSVPSGPDYQNRLAKKAVDARHKAGHDERERS